MHENSLFFSRDCAGGNPGLRLESCRMIVLGTSWLCRVGVCMIWRLKDRASSRPIVGAKVGVKNTLGDVGLGKRFVSFALSRLDDVSRCSGRLNGRQGDYQ